MTKPTRYVMEQLRATLWRRVGDATKANVIDLGTVLVGLAVSPHDAELLDQSVNLAHAVAGSAGVYGFRAEARAASDLEGLLRAWPGAEGIPVAQALVAQLEDGFEVDA